MKNNTTMKKVFTFLALVAVFMSCFATPAFAAGYKYDEPYGFAYKDDITSYIHVDYYAVDKKEKSYVIADGVELRGSTLYTEKTDRLLMKNLKKSSVSNPSVAFDTAGRLYILMSDGTVRRMDNSRCTTYSVATNIKKVTSFILNDDDLIAKVQTSSTKKSVSDLTFKGNYKISDDSIVEDLPNEGNYVQTRARGDGGVIYEAFKDNKSVLKIHCYNSNVWLETYQKLLSSTCRGAKFVGFSRQYDSVLLDQDGTLYLFQYKKYDTPCVISLQEKVLGYERDSSGFIYSVETDHSVYLLDNLFKDKLPKKITYVANDTQNSIAYSGKEVVGTLEKSKDKLYWNDTAMSNSKSPTYFGITADGDPVWISGGNLYFYDGRNIVLGKEKVTRIQYATNGCAESYIVGGGKPKPISELF